MKLAEALLIRADQKKKILSLRERIAQNALAQEGDAPREGIAKLIAECFAVIAEQQAPACRRRRSGGERPWRWERQPKHPKGRPRP